MRLSEFQQKSIHEVLTDVFGEKALILLFGSRVDDSKKGGDIDLFVEADFPYRDLFRKKLTALGKLQHVLGERKIDLVVHSTNTHSELPLIVQQAKLTGIAI